MAEMMRLQIVTPDEAFFDGEVSMVELNTADGEAGIYPKHIPMVVAVAPGVLKIHGADGKIALGGIGMLLWQGEAAFRIFTDPAGEGDDPRRSLRVAGKHRWQESQ